MLYHWVDKEVGLIMNDYEFTGWFAIKRLKEIIQQLVMLQQQFKYSSPHTGTAYNSQRNRHRGLQDAF